MSERKRPRLIAFYLPQFHPISENDLWWGKGFTEWHNVAKASPLFLGHYQPHVPSDLGFYDLRVPETRESQAALARQYGIEGFCYWHYWFEGKRLLERPFAEVLSSGKPDFPFCLAWANETWSRRWLGEERDILIEQTYSPDDDQRHAQWLVSAFADPRYIRVNNRPLFLIYRPANLPDPKRTTETFRTKCREAGLPDPYLLGINAHSHALDSRTIGFDGTLNFEPQLGVLPGFHQEKFSLKRLMQNWRSGIRHAAPRVYAEADARRRMAASRPAFSYYPCVYVRWDNSPRRGQHAIVILETSTCGFEKALAGAVVRSQQVADGDALVFINAWNEWAEGNHLEPDLKYGRAFLEAVKRVADGSIDSYQPGSRQNL